MLGLKPVHCEKCYWTANWQWPFLRCFTHSKSSCFCLDKEYYLAGIVLLVGSWLVFLLSLGFVLRGILVLRLGGAGTVFMLWKIKKKTMPTALCKGVFCMLQFRAYFFFFSPQSQSEHSPQPGWERLVNRTWSAVGWDSYSFLGNGKLPQNCEILGLLVAPQGRMQDSQRAAIGGWVDGWNRSSPSFYWGAELGGIKPGMFWIGMVLQLTTSKILVVTI